MESTPVHQGYLSNDLQYVYKSEIGQRTKYAAITGVGLLSTANSNLDGTGTIVTILSSSATNGTLIRSITIKGAAELTMGMVRLYIEDDSVSPNTDIVAEVEIPGRAQSRYQETYSICILVDFILEEDHTLKASIENGSQDTVIMAEGLDISYP